MTYFFQHKYTYPKLSALILLCLLFACSDTSQPEATQDTSDYSKLAHYTTTPPNKYVPLDTEKELNKIAFGSCNHQDQPQPLWKPIIDNNPDLWIWLGDNIYADTENMDQMKAMYAKQNNHPGYKMLLDTCAIIGTWDDHDYGTNDGDKSFAAKENSKHIMLDFLCVPDSADVRLREGVYQSYLFGKKNKSIKIILLDTRSFRDKGLKSTQHKGYDPNPKGDILGEAQWKWLEEELNTSQATLNIIASGSQIIPKEHYYEKWANYPKSRVRLFKLLSNTPAKNILLLSGDRHIAEISKVKLPKRSQEIYEFTSSGLTHTWKTNRKEDNKYRVGDKIAKLNFGIINIDWENKEVSLEVRGENDKKYHEVRYGFE